jgi:hypothetical protein
MIRIASLVIAAALIVALVSHPVVASESTPYNTSFALEMLHFSGAAYCPGAAVQSWSCSFCQEIPGFTPYGVVYNSTTDMLSYVGYKNDTDSIIVSFRGTNLLSIIDWLTDLDFGAVGAICPGCEVHEGFLKAYLSIRDETVQLVREITTMYPDSDVVITGHSLGGALSQYRSAHGTNTSPSARAYACRRQMASPTVNSNAKPSRRTDAADEWGFVRIVSELTSSHASVCVLCAAYLAAVDFSLNEGINATAMYTFGQPRVGNQVFVDTWNQIYDNATSYRVTHGLDPVPHVPPRCVRTRIYTPHTRGHRWPTRSEVLASHPRSSMPLSLASASFLICRAFDFVHNPTEVYYDGFNTGHKVCDGSGEDPTCADQWLLPLGVSDHVTYLGIDFVAEWLKCNV